MGDTENFSYKIPKILKDLRQREFDHKGKIQEISFYIITNNQMEERKKQWFSRV